MMIPATATAVYDQIEDACERDQMADAEAESLWEVELAPLQKFLWRPVRDGGPGMEFARKIEDSVNNAIAAAFLDGWIGARAQQNR